MNPKPTTIGKPEDICVSLEYAKKLKKSGWQQSYANYWWRTFYDNRQQGVFEGTELVRRQNEAPLSIHHCEHTEYAAPTAEEILRRLPTSFLPKRGDTIHLRIIRHAPSGRRPKGHWRVIYESVDDATHTASESIDESLANAAAAMYCYLSDNNLLPE